MPVKIKGLKRWKRGIKKTIPDARSNFAKEMKRTIVDIIVEKITSGISPVKGQNRYKKYSDMYSKKKGRKQPVDLVDSGDMLNALVARQTNKGSVVVEFKGKEQKRKAAAHHYGAGKLPQRKILPQGREVFKADIMKKILATVNAAIRKAIK